MRIRKILLLLYLLLSSCLPILAQVKFSTIVNEKEVSKNDYVQVEYVVENAKAVEQLTAPAFNGFTIVSGPIQQNGMSVINGAVSKYEGLSFVLKPLRVGKAIIPGATATVEGKQVHSNSVTILITNSASTQSTPNNNSLFGLTLPDEVPEVTEEYLLRKGESAADKIKNNLLVKLDVSKTTCYAGEPIVATYKLCSRLKSESRVTKRPSLSQFSVYDMIQPETNNPVVEKINGKLFNVHIIRKVQLYPLQDGSFELDPVELDNTVRFIRTDENNNKNSMQQLLDEYMDGLTQGKLEEEHITLASKPVTITVNPLPVAGKPDSFDGAIGKFTIAASLAQPVIAANETAVLNVQLKGYGNLPLINAPQVVWPQNAEADEPAVKENIDKTVAPITGSKLFQYSFTVKQPGKIIIPAIEFSYFDPKANAYKTIKTDSIAVTVIKSSKKIKEIKPAAVNQNIITTDTTFEWRNLLWLLPVLIILIAGTSVWKRNKNKKNGKKIAIITPPPVITEKIKVQPHPLEAAKNALVAGNSQLFYKDISTAIWNILSEKLRIPASQLNKPVVTRLLLQRGVATETIQQLGSVLLDCEMALYTPVHTETDMKMMFDKADGLINNLDKIS
jgi:BatD DUF11 like domain